MFERLRNEPQLMSNLKKLWAIAAPIIQKPYSWRTMIAQLRRAQSW